MEYEWLPNNAVGRGDVVFADGEGRFAVVEAKAFRYHSTGASQRSNRTERRKFVRSQARLRLRRQCWWRLLG